MGMKPQTSEYFIQEVSRSLRRNNWTSFASIGTVAVSLFVLGVFLLLVLNMNRMAAALESQVQISVYLEDGLKADDRQDIASDIEALQGIESIRYISKDEAKARLEDRLGDQKYLLDALGDKNPLPDSFEVVVKSPDLVETAAKAIDRMNGVQEAKYGQDVIEHLFAITRLIRIFGLVLMVLLAGATLFIISNTIRLTVFARRKEIAIMKYVGATDWFIRWPFLLEGMVLGFVGGVLAAIALICLLVPCFAIRERDYVNIVPTESNAFESLKQTFSNRNFRVFVGSDVCYWIAVTMFQTGLAFFVTSLMKLDEQYNTIFYIGMTLLSVCFYVPVNRLMKKFEKKKLVMFAFCGMSLVFLITALSGLFGLPGIVSGVLVTLCAAFPMALLGIIPQTIVADIARSDAIVTGENHDGMFFAARTFSMKLGQSVSVLLFTSFATISVSTGLGYRIAAFAAVIFCMIGTLVLHFYDEGKVKAILEKEK